MVNLDGSPFQTKGFIEGCIFADIYDMRNMCTASLKRDTWSQWFKLKATWTILSFAAAVFSIYSLYKCYIGLLLSLN